MSKNPPTDQIIGCLRAELRAIRSRGQYKNADLAAGLGVSASTLSGWLTGSAPMPRIDQLIDLCAALDTTVAEVTRAAHAQAERMTT